MQHFRGYSMDGRLFRWPSNPDLSAYAGVVLERLPSSWVHIGFLYRTETSGGSYVLDLSGHRKLKHEPPRSGHLCVICKIEAVRLPAIAAFARRLWRKNKNHGIPYAFSSPEQEWFSPDGQLQLGPDRLGLTCSNFVLALFRAAGFSLVRLETWESRAEDRQWQESVLAEWGPDIAEARQATQEHFAQVREEIGTVRCRPVEVAAAALAEDLPCNFQMAIQLAEEIEKQLPPAGTVKTA